MKPKIDTAKPFFCAKRACREGGVHDIIRKIIAENGSLMYYDIQSWMAANFRPKSAENFGPGYVRAYVTGAIKDGYITQNEEEKCEYTVIPLKGAAKKAKVVQATDSTAEPKAIVVSSKPRRTKAEEMGVIAQFLRDANNLDSADQCRESKVTAEDIADEFGKKLSAVSALIIAMSEAGVVTTTMSDNGTVYICLTEQGFLTTRGLVEA